ncbi:MAG: beta-hydroxyacyl-ACP dehydratase [Planctomycetes bacterium]|nr:beta-hydroxyacyl-ACP dehydratase [Planctomycetota bacterium]
MPPQPLFDLAKIDMNRILVDQEGIYKVNPHRFEFMLLDAICYLDPQSETMAGFRDVKEDEFWVRGHIPGRPIFPGVLMIETAAQLVSYYANTVSPGKGFLGFGAVDNVKFRGTVTYGQRLLMVGKMLEMRQRRCVGAAQGFVNGQMVFEGLITGMWL